MAGAGNANSESRPSHDSAITYLDKPRRLTFILVGVQQVLELRVEDLQVLLDEHLLALPGELVLRALVEVHLNPALLLQQTGLRLRERTRVSRPHARLFRTRTVTDPTHSPALPDTREKTREGKGPLVWGGVGWEGMLTAIDWPLACGFLCNLHVCFQVLFKRLLRGYHD